MLHTGNKNFWLSTMEFTLHSGVSWKFLFCLAVFVVKTDKHIEEEEKESVIYSKLSKVKWTSQSFQTWQEKGLE